MAALLFFAHGKYAARLGQALSAGDEGGQGIDDNYREAAPQGDTGE